MRFLRSRPPGFSDFDEPGPQVTSVHPFTTMEVPMQEFDSPAHRSAFTATMHVLDGPARASRRGLRWLAAAALFVPFLLATVGVASVSAQSASHPQALKASAAPCNPTITTTSGGLATNYCGPATATFSTGGKTYSFKNGLCESELTTTVALTLGTLETRNGLEATGNANKPYLSLSLTKGSPTQLLNAAYSNGKKLSGTTGMTATGSIIANGSSKGTFKGTYNHSKFSGTWNCHGASFHES
jgi:hypothetical protein